MAPADTRGLSASGHLELILLSRLSAELLDCGNGNQFSAWVSTLVNCALIAGSHICGSRIGSRPALAWKKNLAGGMQKLVMLAPHLHYKLLRKLAPVGDGKAHHGGHGWMTLCQWPPCAAAETPGKPWSTHCVHAAASLRLSFALPHLSPCLASYRQLCMTSQHGCSTKEVHDSQILRSPAPMWNKSFPYTE